MTVAKVSDLLAEIASTGLVMLYEVANVPYACFPSWRDHQRIDRPKPSKLPRPAGLRSTTRRRSVVEGSTNYRRSIDGDQGSRIKEGIEDQGPEGEQAPSALSRGAYPRGFDPAGQEVLRGIAEAVAKLPVEAGTPRRTRRTPGEPVDFTAFWDAYPKKVGKEETLAAWRRGTSMAKKPIPPLDELLPALERAKGSREWTKDGGEYIPNPATWLNKGRWDDQFTPAHAVPRHLLTEVWRDQPAGKVELR
jgi:hypothetical protein